MEPEDPLAPTQDQPTESRAMATGLEVMASAVRYREAMAALVLPWLGDNPIEVGSGTGDFAETWANWGKHLVATEPDGISLAQLRARFRTDSRVDIRSLSLPSKEVSNYSAAVGLNVLEHIEDDIAALRSMRLLVRRGGHVVVIVPAFPFAYGEWDRRIGHYRRYRIPEVRAKLLHAGLKPIQLRYINCIGLIGWWFVVKVLGSEPRDNLLLRLYDRLLIPPVTALERRLSLPFGQSVFAVAQNDLAP